MSRQILGIRHPHIETDSLVIVRHAELHKALDGYWLLQTQKTPLPVVVTEFEKLVFSALISPAPDVNQGAILR